ncbi:hypothetical protein H4582DRAFT_493626 [Lactarius indigo]|nr:hypothetical protein H4582DRAFT_493626 [Lactarius indigo]
MRDDWEGARLGVAISQNNGDLESSCNGYLGSSREDYEKDFLEAHTQVTELSRECESLNCQIEYLINELAEAKRKVVSVRRSIVEEKQSLEQRLDEERRAKERVRHQLGARMDELSKRKAKFMRM